MAQNHVIALQSMKYILSLFICFILLKTHVAKAQICTGSLGDPIINIDFGSGSTVRGAALGTAFTNYTYTTGTPNDGFYTVSQNTVGMYNTWWQTTDHTGNPGGYMMIVNASVSKTDYFYKTTVSGLCPGTTYEFAAWILNLVRVGAILPNVTFTISAADGTVLNTYNTGNIPNSPTGKWTQYGTYFTMPTTGGDISLIMTNNAPGGTGNDLALDDITFRPCGPTIISSFASSASASLSSCAGTNQSYTMNGTPSVGYATPAYQWQVNNGSTWMDIPGATATSYTANFAPALAGTYQYRMASAEQGNISSATCRVVSNVLTVTINSPPSSAVTGGTTLCEGGTIALSASAGDSYSWTGPNNFTSTQQQITIPNALTINSGMYQVTVTKSTCTATGTANVTVNPKVVASAGSDVSICQGSSAQLQATGGSAYSWSPAIGLSDATVANPVASPAGTTTYTVLVSNTGGCSGTAQVTVNVISAPTVNAGPDVKITEGQSVTLNGTITGSNVSYYWTPTANLSDATSLHPVATPNQDITYTLHATTGDPCNFTASSTVFIRVFKKVVIPNTFTPNNDGINDTWGIIALETYPNAFTQVFNRYGKVVFQCQGYTQPWDGTLKGEPLPEGTYYYKIDLKNGSVLAGWVAIIR